MKSSYWNIAKVVWICILVLLIGSIPVAGVASGSPQSGIDNLEIVSAAVDAEFSYQGVLKSGGSPVNGVRNFIFQIHNNTNCTNQLQEIVKTGVRVTEGRFSVNLKVYHYIYNGQRLYLQVVMGSTPLMCEEILAVPYALSIKPGARINSSTGNVRINYYDSADDKAYGVDASASGGDFNYGLKGSITSGKGAGVYAYAGSAGARALHARNNANGTAAYFYGNVKQNDNAHGIVKAGVFAYCGLGGYISRQFGPQTVTISGPGTGACELDFGFDLRQLFWSATAEGSLSCMVTCEVKATDEHVLACERDRHDGIDSSGDIVVLIY